jgi:hypothetical protein
VIAGASGFYTSKNLKNAEGYTSSSRGGSGGSDEGGWVTHYQLPKDAKIHPDIANVPEIDQKRQANQLAYENWNGDLDEDEIKEYYPNLKKNTKPGDVSEDLEKKGYTGHYDSIAGDKGDVTIYDPSKLKLVGATNTATGEFHSAKQLRNAVEMRKVTCPNGCGYHAVPEHYDYDSSKEHKFTCPKCGGNADNVSNTKV